MQRLRWHCLRRWTMLLLLLAVEEGRWGLRRDCHSIGESFTSRESEHRRRGRNYLCVACLRGWWLLLDLTSGEVDQPQLLRRNRGGSLAEE